ncbi:MAG: S8 family serine peptidase, partial [Pirellulaceae bacterium]|nr:S8 family serine peptidase [Pirellulaceae bacterium]
TVNQKNAPSEFVDEGYHWDTLATVDVTGGSLVVTLGAGSSSSKYTVADAVRIEKQADSSPTLTVTIADASFSESAGAAATTGTVTRTDTMGDLVVNLSSDDTSEATVPATVMIFDGQDSALFTIAAVDDSDVDGTQTVTISASASGFTGGSDTIEVSDDDLPRVLTVTIAAASVSESAGAIATTASVTRSDTNGELVVTLSSDDTSEATVPGMITFLDGQSSVSFDIAAVDDNLADGTQTVTIAAAASGYVIGSDTLDVTDDDTSLITILDNGDPGFTETGFRYEDSSRVSAAYDGDNHNMRGGSGTASWTFSGLVDGEYQVAATWAHKFNNRYNTLDAPFSIANGTSGTVLATATINQKNAPSDFVAEGYHWDTLGMVNVTGGSLVVTLGAGSNRAKYTVADAIRIEKTGDSSGGGGDTLGKISGIVWNDADGDGIVSASETPLENWFVFLDQNQNGTLDSSETAVQTGFDGGFLFEDLPDGTYYVTELLPIGWEQTTPSGGSRRSTVPLSTVQMIDSASTEIGWVTDQTQFYFTDISRRSGTENGRGEVSTSSAESASLMNADDFRADPLFTGFNGSGFATVIIDSGADLDHPFYADRLVYSFDFSGTNDSDASDFDGHGTNCAGIAVSSDPNFTGTAPGSDLIVLKVFDDAGEGNFDDIEEALQWVLSNVSNYNIASVNMSLGDGAIYDSAQMSLLSDELAGLVAMDVMVVSAAGNEFTTDGTEGVSYPAVDPNSLAVSAVWDANHGGPHTWEGGTIDNSTAADRVASFSSRSSTLTDVFAPGAFITNAGLNGGTTSLAGTSQAAPQVAGIATVAQQLATSTLGRRLTQAEFRSLMQSTGVSINDGDDEDDNVVNTGADYPRIDMWAFMKGVLATATSGGAVHDITFSSGGTASDLNFGNRVTESKGSYATGVATVSSAVHTDSQGVNDNSVFARGNKAGAVDLWELQALDQKPLSTAGNRVVETFVGSHRRTHFVDTMFSEGGVTQIMLARLNTTRREVVDSLAEIIDEVLTTSSDSIWNGASYEDLLEREDISQQKDEVASLWDLDGLTERLSARFNVDSELGGEINGEI